MRLAWFALALAACSSPPAPKAPDAAAELAQAVTATVVTQPAPPIITARELATRMEATRQALEGYVRAGVSDPKEPWAMAHGLLAFGPDMTAADGRKAIDAIVSVAARDPQSKRHRFPAKTAEGAIVDAHSNLMVKKMIEAGVPWDRVFQVGGKKVTLEALAKDAIASYERPKDDKAWADAPWTITITLLEAKRHPKLDPARERELKGLALETLAELEGQQDFLLALLEQQRPELVEKKKQKIYAHPCGGLHFVQAALHAAAFLGDAQAYARARKQLEVVMFRWMAEREIYRKAAIANPQAALLVRIQELKFYGHVLEVFALARALGMVTPEPELVMQLGGVAQDLMRTVEILTPGYQRLPELRMATAQGYLDMVGDGAHAVHGLREASVAFFAPQ